jgi:hypothetical protein
MDIDAMTGVERPRNRLLWAVVVFLVPVVVIGGGAAFFIHTIIAPIMPGATLFGSYDTVVSTSQPAPAGQSAPQAAAASAQSMFAGLESTSIWPSITPPQSPAPAYASADPTFSASNGVDNASRPIAGPIPMPPPRPRISNASPRGNAPPPRPRRSAGEQD